MFTNEDYKNYFKELEDVLRSNIVIYTDLMNIVDNKAVLSKLQVLASENAGAFKFIREQKGKFPES
ncbi:MAG: hypothetical protein PHO34_00280 [Candidatus Omnitrophica bacterium]|nr:hypothetical protein [Candidatus Omnitrophota bacterium]MDD5500671.1 hypothetical protein [Candidatus Omnitrophota bacterium]